MGLDLAREWTRGLAYGSLFAPWSVKVVNELDRCSKDAQDMLLIYLDRMPADHAFLGTTNLGTTNLGTTNLGTTNLGTTNLGTTNLDIGNLTERFRTRFHSIRLQSPANDVLAQFLVRRLGSPSITITRKLPEGAKEAWGAP